MVIAMSVINSASLASWLSSNLVNPPRVKEAPMQMKAELDDVHIMIKDAPSRAGAVLALGVKILRIHVEESLKMNDLA